MDNTCIYMHLKPCGEVFYIGIGNKNRPKRNTYRNKLWHNVVNKHGYEIQILKSNLSWKDACELESILIDFYGRRDLNKGTLVNMTSGGDGGYGVIVSKETRHKMSLQKKGKLGNRSKKIINIETGFIYNSITEASLILGIKRRTINAQLSGQNKNTINLIYLENGINK